MCGFVYAYFPRVRGGSFWKHCGKRCVLSGKLCVCVMVVLKFMFGLTPAHGIFVRMMLVLRQSKVRGILGRQRFLGIKYRADTTLSCTSKFMKSALTYLKYTVLTSSWHQKNPLHNQTKASCYNPLPNTNYSNTSLTYLSSFTFSNHASASSCVFPGNVSL